MQMCNLLWFKDCVISTAVLLRYFSLLACHSMFSFSKISLFLSGMGLSCNSGFKLLLFEPSLSAQTLLLREQLAALSDHSLILQ